MFVDAEDKGEVLIEVNDDVRAGLIEKMATDQLLDITEGLHTDDLADLLQDLPGALTHELLHSMDKQNRQRLETVLSIRRIPPAA